MDTRLNAITPALQDTCKWLFESKEFQKWDTKEPGSGLKRVIWLKGHPGTGKSTLMKEALRRAQKNSREEKRFDVSFFFNARGSILERSPLGLYRSLLHQLLCGATGVERFPEEAKDFLSNFERRRITRQKWDWELEEVKYMFFHLLELSRFSNVTVYIDAVDECEEEDAREIIDSLRESLSTRKAVDECEEEDAREITDSIQSSRLRICLSSRHYPSILLPGCLELWVEDHNKSDIRKYVDVNIMGIRFESEDTEAENNLKEAIIGKASGIFLWVFLVVRKLRAASEKGESIQKLQALLKDIPPTLDALFRRMISAIKEEAEREKTLTLMQWILFAKQPLDTEELRHALAFSTDDPPPSIASWRMSSEDLEEGQGFERLLVNRSLGLLEVLAAARITNALKDPSMPVDRESRRRVQFIHESVRDFLIRTDAPGLNLLRPTLGIHYVGESHDKLLRGCISYIATEEVRKLSVEIRDSLDVLFDTPSIDKTGGSKLPFLPYAIKHLLEHAFEADHDGAAQINLPNRSLEVNIQTLRAWYRLAQEDDDQVQALDQVDAKAVLLHFACIADITGCCKALVASGVDLNLTVDKVPPLVIACGNGNTELVRYFLQHHADVNSRNDYGITALHRAARGGHTDIVKMLVEGQARFDDPDSRGRTALFLSCAAGRAESVDLLLKHGAQIQVTSDTFRNVLYAAVSGGSTPVVELILKECRNSNLHDLVNLEDTGMTPLQQSLSKPVNVDIVKLLLLDGADLWMGHTTSPLELLFESEYLLKIASFLFVNELVTPENIDNRDAMYGRTLLHWAAGDSKHYNVVKFLLDKGANSKIRDKNGLSPYEYAIETKQGAKNASLLTIK